MAELRKYAALFAWLIRLYSLFSDRIIAFVLMSVSRVHVPTIMCTGNIIVRFRLDLKGATRGVMVSMSAFLAYHQCYCEGSSLAWGLNLRAVVCGIF